MLLCSRPGRVPLMLDYGGKSLKPYLQEANKCTVLLISICAPSSTTVKKKQQCIGCSIKIEYNAKELSCDFNFNKTKVQPWCALINTTKILINFVCTA